MADGQWWRDAVIYQVHPRSFADSNGDGVGDLNGVRSRLPHLRDLGVDAVWLSPFYVSPQADGGYDVADYRAVDPLFGTPADAEALIADAHALGLRVLVDLVPNHSSDRHDWFRRAPAGGPGSPARDRYHFRPGRGARGELPPNDWHSLFGGPAWTRAADPDGSPGDWYLHLFAPEQPDFNWANPEVAEEFRAILRFWPVRGVDGFRVDVAHGLVKAEGLPDHGRSARLLDLTSTPFWDQDGVHEVYRDWRRLLDSYPGERIGVAEAWGRTPVRTANYVRPDELHQAFNFHHLTCSWEPAALRAVVDDSLAAMRAVGAPATWLLSNHDVVRHATRLAPGADRARAATLLMLALPGSAYLYQGEELGLPEVVDLPDASRRDPAFRRTGGRDGHRDGCRVPLPWHGDRPPYGFGPAGGPSRLPQPDDWAELSAAAQDGVPGSTLELYRAALAPRRAHPALGGGDDLVWLPGDDAVLAFERGAGDEVLRCAANAGGHPVEVEVGPAGELLLSSAPVDHDGAHVVLPPDTAIWWIPARAPRAAPASAPAPASTPMAAQTPTRSSTSALGPPPP
ncbi:glycoside hydrolase family 13 protein [Saccharothrix xinjiangensis]|uniref:Glycoside hydrolase family 13 protein n=1 Tax=Saccharothrix xinjiangensis TaxID=204798 RepID=A0ABV9Y3I0_9PSEU